MEELVAIADAVIMAQSGRHLSDLETAILLGAIANQTYDEIAKQSGYSISHVKRHIGPRLWQLLSQGLDEEVSKTNFRTALKRCGGRMKAEKLEMAAVATQPSSPRKAAMPNLTPAHYVERPPIETICYETLLLPGALLRIKAPTLMGKTCLVNWLIPQMAAHHYQIANISLKFADRKVHFANLDKFLRWFCFNLSRELGVPHRLEDYWIEELGAKISCTSYLEDYLLAQSDTPIMLCLDDVDVLFPYPDIYEDFFGLLRSWYEKAKSRTVWQKLRLVLVHSTDVYIRLSIHHSPFNVGIPIELAEFNRDQVQLLAKQHQIDRPAVVESLIELVGGHPYLLEQAFSYLKTHPLALDQLLTSACTDAGIYSHHLRSFWLNLQAHPDLANALKTVVTTAEPVQLAPVLTYQLQSMGVVRLVGNQVEPRCQLYRQYFADRFNYYHF